MANWPIRIMVYGAGEAINGANGLAAQIQTQLNDLSKVCTNQYVAALAQLEASDAPAKRLVLDPSGRQPIYQLSNINVGDPGYLVEFANWSASVCPADRSVLILSGHGAAWQDRQVADMLGIPPGRRGIDSVPEISGAIHHPRFLFGREINAAVMLTKAVLIDGSNRDFLTNAELGDACQRIAREFGSRIDVLVFDACLMSAWELLQELRGSVNTVVASIDELSAAGIGIESPARQLTTARGAADAKAIATTIVQCFSPQTSFDSCVAVDLQAGKWGSALSSFSNFCSGLLSWIQVSDNNANAIRAALRLATTSVVQYSSGGLSDVSSLATAIASVPTVPAEVIADIKSAASFLQGCILAKTAGRDYEAAIGLSIFTPNSVAVYNRNRSDYVQLQFSSQTGWSKILDSLFR